MDTYSDRNSSSGSELSELAIHTLLVEIRQGTWTVRCIRILTAIATLYQAKESLTTQRMTRNDSGIETFDKPVAAERGSQD